MPIKICALHDKVVGEIIKNIGFLKQQFNMRHLARYQWLLMLLFVAGFPMSSKAIAASEKSENENKIKITAEDRLKALERITSFNQSPEINRREIYKGNVLNNVPDVLNTPAAKDTLIARMEPPIYQHNPIKGPMGAPVTIVEFSDISCLTCDSMRKQLDDLLEKYPTHIRWVHKHASDNPYKSENIAIFYSKIANKNNIFWEFRRQLEKLESYNDEVLIEALGYAGMPVHNSRRLVRLYARDVYREIDADLALNRKLGLGKTPALLVNGIQVGGSIPFESLEDLVRYELERQKVTILTEKTDETKKTK